MRRILASVALATFAASCLAGPLHAAGIATDGSVNSSYVWRGLSFTNKPVFQPAATVTVPTPAAEFGMGAWANVEPMKYDRLEDLSQSGGQGSFDVTEVDLWAEATRAYPAASITAGVLGYMFPNDAAFTKEFNTVELYAKARFPKVPLSPSVAWYQDVSKVNGAYVEASVSHPLKLNETSTLTFALLGGLSAGQEVNAGSDDLANFDGSGLTHVDFSATASFPAGAVRLAPTAHLVLAQDEFTKITAPGETATTKVWVGMTASWAGSFGAHE